ncbi:MAG: sugar-binding domain-containing protein, partial [Gillisia sp.]
MKILFSFFAAFFSILSVVAQKDPLLINVYNRDTKSLNGNWHYIVDPYENGFYNYRYQPFEDLKNPGSGAFFTNSKPKSKSDLIEYNFDESDTIAVPGDWNTQKEKLFYYEGSVWYKKSFDYTKKQIANKVFVYFGAVNYQADVYFNGKKIGKHVGGFTPFNFEVTDLLKEKDNFLILKVDNTRKKNAVPTLNTDWFNYGGITRDVKLVETPATYIQDYLIQLDSEDDSEIKGYIQLKGEQVADQSVQLEIPELGIKKKYESGENGKVMVRLKVRNVKYWSPENPKLYEVKISASGDKVTDTVGFRSIKTEGTDILLNGKKIFLRGISIHEESPLHDGRAYSLNDAKKLLSMAKELGC